MERYSNFFLAVRFQLFFTFWVLFIERCFEALIIVAAFYEFCVSVAIELGGIPNFPFFLIHLFI
jgi:hypothetical protein